MCGPGGSGRRQTGVIAPFLAVLVQFFSSRRTNEELGVFPPVYVLNMIWKSSERGHGTVSAGQE